jgi:uncharacterized protein (TIGR02284 family)
MSPTNQEEAVVQLEREHLIVAASLGRLSDFVAADDPALAREEWDALEDLVLAHLDAEEMFLLPAYERAAASEADAIREGHTRIRRMLGDLAVAIELHTLRVESVSTLREVLMSHIDLENRTLYPWARTHGDTSSMGALLRRAGNIRGASGLADAALAAVLRACDDGEKGYRAAASEASDPGCQLVFAHYADERARFAKELQTAAHEAMGAPILQNRSPFGTLHRGWMEARAMLARGGSRTVLGECQRGEDAALRTYRAALRADLQPSVRELVQEQYDAVKRARAEVSSLFAAEVSRAS